MSTTTVTNNTSNNGTNKNETPPTTSGSNSNDNNSNATNNDGGGGDENSSNDPDNKTNLIVNYLPQTMTDEEFRVLFAKYGDLRSARIIRNKASGYSHGFGFVEYFRSEEAEQAIQQLNGVVINHKKIKVSFARPSGNNIKNANIYVTNLPATHTEKEIRSLFDKCGKIIQVRLLNNRPGTAFILFNLHEEAKKAIDEFDKQCVPGTNCRMQVKFATNEKRVPKEDGNSYSFGVSPSTTGASNIELVPRLQRRNSNGNSSLKSRGYTGYPDTSANYQQQSQHLNRRMSPGPMRYTSHNNRFNPMSTGQPYHESSSYMDHLSSMMYTTGDGRHHHHQQAYMYGAGGLDQSSSSYMASSSSTNHHPAAVAHHPYYQQSAVAAAAAAAYNTIDNGSTATGPGAEYVLFVYNIGPDTSEADLTQLFGIYGTVTRVNVIRKSGSGEGKGYGFVTMTDYTEACGAITSLNGYKFVNNKPLQVSFKKRLTK